MIFFFGKLLRVWDKFTNKGLLTYNLLQTVKSQIWVII